MRERERINMNKPKGVL
jgi:hypothetical protein